MNAARARDVDRRRRSSAVRVGTVLAVVVLAIVAFTATRSDPQDQAAAPVEAPRATLVPTREPERLLPRDSPTSAPAVEHSVVETALAAPPAPFGTFVVAKSFLGVEVETSPTATFGRRFEVPVYDEPFGEPRALVFENPHTGATTRHALMHGGAATAPLALRVIAGAPGDDWLHVQSPGRSPTDSMWVHAEHFHRGFTTRRIEIDLADGGNLRLIDGGAIMVDAPIDVDQDHRPQTQITSVAGGPHASSADEVWIDLASFITGDDEMMRLAISAPDVSNEAGPAPMTVAAEVALDLASRTGPGTPVVIFDSSIPGQRHDAVVSRSTTPAPTVDFGDRDLLIGESAFIRPTTRWRHCQHTLVRTCANEPVAAPATLVPVGNVFLTARPDAGQQLVGVGAVVPVYDEPGGRKRLLIDRNDVDFTEYAYPTYHPTMFGQPLVMNVLQGAPGDKWVLVQAPVRPHRQKIWVHADDFTWGQTLLRIEVDLGNNGELTLYDNNEPVISALSVYGRESRPTTLHDTYVEQAFEGRRLSPAYGTYVLTLASYSEALGSFGGGGMPGQSLHGTNQPELVGMRVSSGGIRVANEVIDFIYVQPGIVGAGVIIFDSGGIGREAAIRLQRFKTWLPAATTTFPLTGLRFAGPHSYS